MNILEIINIINKILQEYNISNTGHLVCRKTLEESTFSPLYKIFNLEVWFINDKNKFIITKVQCKDRAPKELVNEIWHKVELEITKCMLEMLYNGKLIKYIKDELDINRD